MAIPASMKRSKGRICRRGSGKGLRSAETVSVYRQSLAPIGNGLNATGTAMPTDLSGRREMTELNRIMCVDDNLDILTITKFMLEAMGGFSVMTRESAQEALEKVDTFDPDLFVLDVMMPEIDGPTLFQKLRDLPKWESTPIMFMTAKCQAHEVAKLMELGSIGVIPKPFDPVGLPTLLMQIWDAWHSELKVAASG